MRGRELYECAGGMLALRDRLLERWEEGDREIIRLGSSTIPSAYILPELLRPTAGNGRMCGSTFIKATARASSKD